MFPYSGFSSFSLFLITLLLGHLLVQFGLNCKYGEFSTHMKILNEAKVNKQLIQGDISVMHLWITVSKSGLLCYGQGKLTWLWEWL